MAITSNQDQAKAAVLAREPLWTPKPPLPNGATDHGENRGWVAEALQGTPYAVLSGTEWVINRQHPHGDQLWEELVSTQWGRDIRGLWSSDGAPLPVGWKRGGFNAPRPLWWIDSRHEVNGTNRLVGQARLPSNAQASVAAVPGNSDAFWMVEPDTAPDDEAEWLDDCQRYVLHAEQYAALRVSLGLPGQPPVEPPEPPVEPPEPPEPETDPHKLKLRDGRFSAWVKFSTTNDPDTAKWTLARAVPLQQFGDTCGMFWFFSADNAEVDVKVLGPSGGKYWVYASAMSDVGFTLFVEDTKTKATRTYLNRPGEFAGLARDTEAFEA